MKVFRIYKTSCSISADACLSTGGVGYNCSCTTIMMQTWDNILFNVSVVVLIPLPGTWPDDRHHLDQISSPSAAKSHQIPRGKKGKAAQMMAQPPRPISSLPSTVLASPVGSGHLS